MKDTLDTTAEEMRNMKGYQKIYTIVTQLLELMPSVPTFMAMIGEEVKKLMGKRSKARA